MLIYLMMLDTPEERTRFEKIYLMHRDMMYRVAYGILRNEHDAEDAVHNAFLWIIKNFERFMQAPTCEGLAPLNAIITRNEAITIRRRQDRTVPVDDWDELQPAAAEIGSYDALVESFTRLPPTYRAVLEMKLLLGYSDGEIAAKLGLTKTAVSTRVSRGRKLLREIVTKDGFQMP